VSRAPRHKRTRICDALWRCAATPGPIPPNLGGQRCTAPRQGASRYSAAGERSI